MKKQKLSPEQLKEERKKWGVPDWRIDSEYTYTDHDHSSPLINDQLRWEFLRRNPDYRELWEDGKSYRSVFGLIEPINPALRGDQLGCQTILFINSVLRGGMASMAAPKCDCDEDYVYKYGKFLLDSEQDGFLILGFDPSYPTRPQIERAKKILDAHKEKLKQVEYSENITGRDCQIETPSLLLRTLDSHNEGESLLTIGREVFLSTNDDADGKATARSFAKTRLDDAKTYWQRVYPKKHNTRL